LPSPLNDLALKVITQMASERSTGNAYWLNAILDAF